MQINLRNKYWLLLFAVICFSVSYFIGTHKTVDHSTTVKRFERVLHRKEKYLRKEVDTLARNAEKKPYDQLFKTSLHRYQNLFTRKGMVLLIYQNDTLRYWSDHTVAVENYLKEVCLDNRLVQLKNGWFEVIKETSKPSGIKTVFGLLLIKKDYPYQNQYLNNDFQKDFHLDKHIQLKEAGNSSRYTVETDQGNPLCSLVFPASLTNTGMTHNWQLVLDILACLLILLYLKQECDSLSASIGVYWSGILFTSSILALRFLTIKTHFPAEFYNLPLFNPQYYGDATSFWLPSLGDLLINALLILYIVYYLGNRWIKEPLQLERSGIISFVLFEAIFWAAGVVNTLMIGLIRNSSISFDVNNLFNLSFYSYVGLFIIGILFLALFLLIDKIIKLTTSQQSSGKSKLYLIYALAAVLYLLSYFFVYGISDPIILCWPLVLVPIVARIRKNDYNFSGIMFIVIILAICSAHILLKYSNQREQDNRVLLAQKLAAEQDPIAEHIFGDLEKKIIADTNIVNELRPVKDDFDKQLIQKYFDGYWEKYDVEISVYDTACTPLVNGSSLDRDNLTFFENAVKTGRPTESPNFYYLNNPSGKISYVAAIPLYLHKQHKNKFATLYIELDSKFVSEQIGFPQLLLDREVGMNNELTSYSYAKYKNHQLVFYHGKYEYGLSSAPFDSVKASPGFIHLGGYNHLVYKSDDGSLVVLSKKDPGQIAVITTFSYLFAFFSLLLLLIVIGYRGAHDFRSFHMTFKNRIQYLLVAIVLISLALSGIGTIIYIKRQYQDKNKENISNKMFSALVEVRQELGKESPAVLQNQDYLSYVLKRVANIFFTDINLYDTHGNLIASSIPKLFDEGLMSRKMCPQAYYQLAVNHKLQYTDNERIGNLEYLSSYVLFKNDQGKLIGYLNLPYFAKQSELEQEISTFLIALINIYVFLFVLSVVIAVFISGYVTKPLKLIQDKLSKIKLGKTNEPIEWKENDEIGSLVHEYNRMIGELAESADLLAKSERESAWREMAKQVAHEIKNPLTPMKLSVQHLQRTWQDKSPDIDEKMQRLTATLIEQIETLSSIASAFSSFAKMPRPNNEKINIQTILQSIVELFKETSNVAISFRSEVGDTCCIYADKDQLLRVFNNLIKNAIQAIPAERKGKIDVLLLKKNNNYEIRIHDNGIGISEDQLDKIFVPNFTTKTGGMGLGLAMVKNIIESFHGSIAFETIKGESTTFIVSLPEYKE